jgi:hypothetical protein
MVERAGRTVAPAEPLVAQAAAKGHGPPLDDQDGAWAALCI